MTGKRIEYLDAIKGFSIVLMVMAHSLAWSYQNWTDICLYNINQANNVKMAGFLWQLIYSFHMPLFFLVSGFLLYRKDNLPNFISFLKNKINRLLLPWLSSFAIAYVVRKSMGYWFLLSLFELCVIEYFVIVVSDKFLKNDKLWIDILLSIITYSLIKLIANVDILDIEIGKFANYYLPFACGTLMKKYGSFLTLINKKTFFPSACLILFITFFSARYFIEQNIFFVLLHKIGIYVLPFLGSWLVWNFFANSELKVIRVFSFLGRKTLPIYIFHIMFVIQLTCVGDFIVEQLNFATSLSLQLTFSIFASSIAISLSLLLYVFLRKIPICSRFLFAE